MRDIEKLTVTERDSQVLFNCDPGEIVEIRASELTENSASQTTLEPRVVHLVAQTRTPWLSIILYGGLVAIFGISCFLIGLQSGINLRSVPQHSSSK